jgi:hypothetical protein
MSVDAPTVTTPDEFQRRLDALISEAYRNDVLIERGWSCRPQDGTSQYEAHITEVVADSD